MDINKRTHYTRDIFFEVDVFNSDCNSALSLYKSNDLPPMSAYNANVINLGKGMYLGVTNPFKREIVEPRYCHSIYFNVDLFKS